MALEHAILTALSERSGSGYELARRFDRSFGYFYGASHQQIYRTLRRMDAAEWVRCTPVAQDGRPDKKVYSVADEGAAELRRWLAHPGDIAVIRDELSVKIRAASHGRPADVLAEVRRHGGEHRARLALYRRMQDQDFPDPPALTGRALHQYLVLRGGVRLEEALVAWCDEVAATLEAGEATTADAPAPTTVSPTRKGPAR